MENVVIFSELNKTEQNNKYTEVQSKALSIAGLFYR